MVKRKFEKMRAAINNNNIKLFMFCYQVMQKKFIYCVQN